MSSLSFAAFGSFPVSAALLIIFSARVLWRVWLRLDLSPADTSYYFYHSISWLPHRHFPNAEALVFSPLYCAFYAFVINAFPDAGVATIIHRLFLLLVTSIAILVVARRVLPRPWAWLVAAWWIALPVNWAGLYEVHLFGFCLAVIACACAGAMRSPWGRGCALAILGVDALLVRNELVLALGFFGLCCAAEICFQSGRENRLKTFASIGAPSAAAAALSIALFSSNLGGLNLGKLRVEFITRERANFGQAYPFNYQQRRADWNGDPWHDGSDLIQRDFGRPQATFSEAMRINPAAWFEYVKWNVSLVPSGLQLALFNGYSGGITPDWGETRRRHASQPVWFILAALLLWCGGGTLIILRRRLFSRLLLRASSARWVWIFLFCCLPTALVAIVTQRPRPSYIYPSTLLLMLFTALSFWLITKSLQRRLGLQPSAPEWLPAIGAVILFLVLPGSNASLIFNQPLLQDYERLKPFHRLFRHDHLFCTDSRLEELANYLSTGGKRVSVIRYSEIEAKLRSGFRFDAALDVLGITEIYLRKKEPARSEYLEWRQSAASTGKWRLAGSADDESGSWDLWSRAGK